MYPLQSSCFITPSGGPLLFRAPHATINASFVRPPYVVKSQSSRRARSSHTVRACTNDPLYIQPAEQITATTYDHIVTNHHPCLYESPAGSQASDALYNGGGPPSGNIPGDGGGSGSGGGDGGDFTDDESLPDDMKLALAYGSLSREAIGRYLRAMRNPFTRALLSIPAFRSRFLMDSAFLFKLLVQEVIGNGTALIGEIKVRGKDIVHELEYVASDLIIGTVIEAAFVWLLAPTLALPSVGQASALSTYFAGLPSHMFQPSTALQTFSITQRIASVLCVGVQYAAIGFVGGVVGTAITYAIIRTRKVLDKDYAPARPLPPVFPNSAGWAAFMAGSSNPRFQIVEGLELAVARAFQGVARPLVNPSIVALRFLNNYYGGVQFVEFFRAIGLHATESTSTES